MEKNSVQQRAHRMPLVYPSGLLTILVVQLIHPKMGG